MKRILINVVAVLAGFTVLLLVFGNPVPADIAIMYSTMMVLSAIDRKKSNFPKP